MEQRQQVERKRGQKDEATTWDRMIPTRSGRQVVIHISVPKELRDRMRKVAPLLVGMERQQTGKGIKRNFPGAYTKYCIKAVTESLEEIMRKMEQTTKE